MTVAGDTHVLSRAAAMALQEAVADALTARETFLRTAGTHRPDGSYVVSRRTADSSGNSTVFEGFDNLCDRYRELPTVFGAADVEAFGVTGSRRHMVVWHLIEHPAFPCGVASRNPLEARKAPGPIG